MWLGFELKLLPGRIVVLRLRERGLSGHCPNEWTRSHWCYRLLMTWNVEAWPLKQMILSRLQVYRVR